MMSSAWLGQRGAGARELRVLVRELEQVAHDGAAFGAVVAEQDAGGARVQFLDGRKAHQRRKLAPDDDAERERGGGGEGEAEEAEAFAAREQILDQMGDAEPEAEQHQAGDRRSRTACPSGSRGAARRAPRSEPAIARDRVPA